MQGTSGLNKDHISDMSLVNVEHLLVDFTVLVLFKLFSFSVASVLMSVASSSLIDVNYVTGSISRLLFIISHSAE